MLWGLAWGCEGKGKRRRKKMLFGGLRSTCLLFQRHSPGGATWEKASVLMSRKVYSEAIRRLNTVQDDSSVQVYSTLWSIDQITE